MNEDNLKRSKPISRPMLLRGLALMHDGVMGAVAMLLSFVLRLDFDGVAQNLAVFLNAAVLFGIVVSGVGFLLGLNRGIWRYASLSDFLAIAYAASLSVASFTVIEFLLDRLNSIPRSSILIAWAFLIVLLAGPRAAYRLYRNRHDVIRGRLADRGTGKHVLLIGATDNAEAFLRTIKERNSASFEVLAIIDERGRRTGRSIRGVPVLGPLERLPQILNQFEARGRRPEAIILTRSRDDYQRHASVEALVEIAARQKVEILRLPNLFDMQRIDAEIELRPIKLEDLLQRQPVMLDSPKIASMIEGKTVLITGAGGSIGSELARQVAALSPRSLVLVDASEYALYSIESELSGARRNFELHASLCNVREKGAVNTVVQSHRPHVIFHAAALKHVPIIEAQPLEGILTNAIGTRNVAEAALRANVPKMIMVSTDKAVNPTSVMGATKRMAEMFCQAMDLDSKTNSTRFVTVRFGNVLGSAGSVVPLFEKQIKAGGPVTVTDPEIERFFMTIPEACLLVMQAAAHNSAQQEERGRIYVLDMGPPVKIVDLARNLIRLSGRRPDTDIRIVYTGLRPGEKLYEELFDSKETLSQTGATGILTASARSIELALIERIFDEMQRMIDAQDLPGALRLLKSTVAEFNTGAHVHH
ncbi:nucleoside-diphosphate sugar epimerase/dehydratase [Mesorhizobium sp. B2-3-5]|uniref:polysaccharide biosynthesis protein n=1 Tax=Mesorhizobium sp. B2-3-5 TaxID=2589958 RepID=UPI0011277A07|nr:nucleoside-diphosphate sugar epimerase/dehydratase [Mesorhizobium sp. B2-3-5]TPM13634.1 polysaccharide biosynthesis protein [Mesorhizobium sp. B2-3-5]